MSSNADQSDSLTLEVRGRSQFVMGFVGSRPVGERAGHIQFSAAKSAMIICDMWDTHWCDSARDRIQVLAPQIERASGALREAGFAIIHSPSSTMGFYGHYEARSRMAAVDRRVPERESPVATPPLPIDDSDGGCDSSADRNRRVLRQNVNIAIEADDAISDDGSEIVSWLAARDIDLVVYAGVHLNQCLLDRSFGIKQMRKWEVCCVLLRDLTDIMYNPARRPFVERGKAMEIVVDYIEEYWCPTTTSEQLLAALGRGQGPRR